MLSAHLQLKGEGSSPSLQASSQWGYFSPKKMLFPQCSSEWLWLLLDFTIYPAVFRLGATAVALEGDRLQATPTFTPGNHTYKCTTEYDSVVYHPSFIGLVYEDKTENHCVILNWNRSGLLKVGYCGPIQTKFMFLYQKALVSGSTPLIDDRLNSILGKVSLNKTC